MNLTTFDFRQSEVRVRSSSANRYEIERVMNPQLALSA